MSDKAAILKALEQVAMPGGGTLAASGALSDVIVHQGKAYFSISVASDQVRAFRAPAQKPPRRPQRLFRASPPRW